MDDWREVTVGEISAPSRNALVGGPFGSNLVSRDYVEVGVPVIRGQNMGGRWVSGQFAFVSEQKAMALNANLARPGDIVFTQRGTLGQVSLVPDEPFGVISQSQMKLTVDQKLADPLFIYYVFTTVEQQEYIRQNSIQVGVPHTNLGILRTTPIRLPPLREQCCVSSILGALDDKIDLNRRMNETLEATARAIFKDWFVDFGPTRAKMEGRAPYLAPEIWALFPDRLDDEGKPEGWIASTIGQEVDVVGGSTPSTKDLQYWNGNIAWATPKDLSLLSAPVLLGTERQITDAGLSQISSGLLPIGTVLLSSRAPIGYMAIAHIPTAINQGFIAMVCRRRLSNIFVWLWTQANMDTIHQNANGSTFQEISKANFRPIAVNVPKNDLLLAFDGAVKPLFDRIVSNEREIVSLTAARDVLLPRLISGEIRVKEAAKVAEAAL
jgi:type I restriction enzyme S subunit